MEKTNAINSGTFFIQSLNDELIVDYRKWLSTKKVDEKLVVEICSEGGFIDLAIAIIRMSRPYKVTFKLFTAVSAASIFALCPNTDYSDVVYIATHSPGDDNTTKRESRHYIKNCQTTVDRNKDLFDTMKLRIYKSALTFLYNKSFWLSRKFRPTNYWVDLTQVLHNIHNHANHLADLNKSGKDSELPITDMH